MVLGSQPKLFGSRLRTQILLVLGALEESYPSEIARIVGSQAFPVQRVLDALESEGVVASRKLGVERRTRLNPRYGAVKELRALLSQMLILDTETMDALAQERRRPRRRKKA